MAYLVEFPTNDGSTVLVEMDDEQLVGFEPAGASPGEVLKRTTDTLEDALDRVLPAARAVSTKAKELAPDELTVQIGVKLTAEAGVILSKVAGEANVTISLKWMRDA